MKVIAIVTGLRLAAGAAGVGALLASGVNCAPAYAQPGFPRRRRRVPG
jgi:hypothetical protein